MRVIILSAGQGRRLLPLTAAVPKCLLPVAAGRSVLELQLAAVERCGCTSATVMVGAGAEKVEAFLATQVFRRLEPQARYNPFFATTDNLVTCWLARCDMSADFVLLNGDTIFEPEVLRRLLASRRAPVTVAVCRKATYDGDDMKVTLNGGTRLRAIGKTIPAHLTHGEAIGLTAFRGEGADAFRDALDRAVRDPAALKRWYLDVIDTMARSVTVECVLVENLWWMEIDTPDDLAKARADLARKIPRGLEPPSGAAAPEVERVRSAI